MTANWRLRMLRRTDEQGIFLPSAMVMRGRELDRKAQLDTEWYLLRTIEEADDAPVQASSS